MRGGNAMKRNLVSIMPTSSVVSPLQEQPVSGKLNDKVDNGQKNGDGDLFHPIVESVIILILSSVGGERSGPLA